MKHAAAQQQSRTIAMPVPPTLDTITSRKANTTLSTAMYNPVSEEMTTSISGPLLVSSLPSSVADSMATTHIALSLEKRQERENMGR